MHKALEPLTEQLTCEQCHQALKMRMRDAIVQWASVKVSQANHDHDYSRTLLTRVYDRQRYDDIPISIRTKYDFFWMLIATAFGTLTYTVQRDLISGDLLSIYYNHVMEYTRDPFVGVTRG